MADLSPPFSTDRCDLKLGARPQARPHPSLAGQTFGACPLNHALGSASVGCIDPGRLI
jgi:hypothetical protein